MTKIIISALVVLSTAVGYAGDKAAGKKKSATCIACHGAKGISANPMWPSLAGQKDKYLVKQLKDFKSGKRKDPLMTAQAKMLSAKDMENIAAYYASLK